MGVKGGLAKFLAKEGNKLSRTAKDAAGAAVEKGEDLLKGVVKTGKEVASDAAKGAKSVGKDALKFASKHPVTSAVGASLAADGVKAAADKKKKKKRDWE